MLDIRVGGKYRLSKRLGKGSCGDIFLGSNIQSSEEVAIKLEEITHKPTCLINEGKILKSLQGGQGIPTVHWFGSEGSFNSLVLDLLGSNLQDLFKLCNHRFSSKTVCMIADQLISRLEYIHSKNFVHRDIKPQNFLIGQGKRSNCIYVIDFGLAKVYKDSKSNKHIDYIESKGFTGNPRYASINALRGVEQSRRDDLESLAYVLLYFMQGSLPWQGLISNRKEIQHKRILESKLNLVSQHREVPEEIALFLEYCRQLKFAERPNYAYLKKIFTDMAIRERYEYDFVFDWTIANYSYAGVYQMMRPCVEDNDGLDSSLIAHNASLDINYDDDADEKSDRDSQKCFIF